MRICDLIEEGKILEIFNDILQFRVVKHKNMCLDTNLNKLIIRGSELLCSFVVVIQ